MMPKLEDGLVVIRVISRHEGKSTAITGEKIHELTGVDPRVVAEVVRIAVSLGVRVASCAAGYYKPTLEELQGYLDREQRRLGSLGEKIAHAKRNISNELTLFE